MDFLRNLFQIFRPALRGARAGGRKGRGLGGRNFRPPALAAKRRNLFFRGASSGLRPDAFLLIPPLAGYLFSFLRLGLKFGVRIFFKKSSDFVQKAPHFKNFSFWGHNEPAFGGNDRRALRAESPPAKDSPRSAWRKRNVLVLD
jgi:hypothetical protein